MLAESGKGLHLVEVDDELRERYLFRPPLVFIPVGSEDVPKMGNVELERAVSAGVQIFAAGEME